MPTWTTISFLSSQKSHAILCEQNYVRDFFIECRRFFCYLNGAVKRKFWLMFTTANRRKIFFNPLLYRLSYQAKCWNYSGTVFKLHKNVLNCTASPCICFIPRHIRMFNPVQRCCTFPAYADIAFVKFCRAFVTFCRLRSVSNARLTLSFCVFNASKRACCGVRGLLGLGTL